jgi:hypothetical protein
MLMLFCVGSNSKFMFIFMNRVFGQVVDAQLQVSRLFDGQACFTSARLCGVECVACRNAGQLHPPVINRVFCQVVDAQLQLRGVANVSRVADLLFFL